ncbi:hypothetical protein CYPRO_0923 [Cyclonatronum proteinivorum]|uniref:Long-chain fatty acid transport protein n=2 Tax=Cyclonatronum proteinivorum TaxID=1457365 RepID=A0A345UI98_9BACT|nr:hypothetical protein CYPRO_0923 [Cyclonatronum proteinivorum]
MILVLMVLHTTTAHAQENLVRSASVYSVLGLGMPQDYLSIHGTGMSLIGVATPDRTKGTLANPAMWGSTYLTHMTVSGNVTTFAASDGVTDASSTLVGFDRFQAQIPLIRERLGLSAGLYRSTDVRYTLIEDSNIVLPTADSLSVVDYTSAVSGTGGINRLEVGLGLRLNNHIFIGYAPSMKFGIIDEDNQILFNSSLYSPVRYNQRTRYRGIAHRFGTMITLPRVFSSRDQLVFGATATLSSDLSAHRKINTRILTGQILNDLELVPEDEFGKQNVTYPFETTLGLSYFPTQYTLFSAEVHFQQWSQLNSFESEEQLSFMKDRVRLGFGFEYDAFSRGNEGLFNSLIYRAGFSYDNGHLSIEGTDIDTMLFSVGLGIPSPSMGSSLDLSFDFGLRGTEDDGLVRERIFGLRASLSFSELMFLQRRVN